MTLQYEIDNKFPVDIVILKNNKPINFINKLNIYNNIVINNPKINWKDYYFYNYKY